MLSPDVSLDQVDRRTYEILSNFALRTRSGDALSISQVAMQNVAADLRRIGDYDRTLDLFAKENRQGHIVTLVMAHSQAKGELEGSA